MAQEVITITITRRQLKAGLWSAALILLAAYGMFSLAPRLEYQRQVAAAKQNLHAIQLGLERFAVDSPNATYPLRVEELLSAGYLSALPPNPFTGQPMQPVQVDVRGYNGRGWLQVPGAHRGDFVYYPRFDETGTGEPIAYTLFLY